MTLGFATSARSSVGLEWELMLADRSTGDLAGRAPEILDELAPTIELERFSLTSELLTNTVEVTSGIGSTVAEAAEDMVDGIRALRTATEPRDLDLLCARLRLRTEMHVASRIDPAVDVGRRQRSQQNASNQ